MFTCFVSPTVVYNAIALNAPPAHLLRQVSKNVCFIVVEHYFLRFGRVLVRDFFMLCFCIDTPTVFLMDFCGFVRPQGFHGVPNGSLLGTLRDQISVELCVLVPRWFPDPKKEPFGVTLASLWGVF